MGIFGPGVGGGLLALAGGAAGVGQGIEKVGEQQQKANLDEHLNDLAQKREEAITRLQGSQQSQLEEQRAGHQEADVEKEIAGRSAVAQFEAAHKETEAAKGREFTGQQNEAHRASSEKIAAGHDAAKVAASQNRQGAPKQDKEWATKNVNVGGSIDPVSHMPVGGRSLSIMVHRDGSQFVPVGDKLIPYDASAEDGLGTKPGSLARAPAANVNTLVNNPLGNAPSGMTLKDSFLQRYGYLPRAYLSSAQAARDQATQAQGAPKSGGFGGSTPPTASDDNEQPDPSESEPEMQAPPSP